MLPKPTITRRPEKAVCLVSGIVSARCSGGGEALRARAVPVKPDRKTRGPPSFRHPWGLL